MTPQESQGGSKKKARVAAPHSPVPLSEEQLDNMFIDYDIDNKQVHVTFNCTYVTTSCKCVRKMLAQAIEAIPSDIGLGLKEKVHCKMVLVKDDGLAELFAISPYDERVIHVQQMLLSFARI